MMQQGSVLIRYQECSEDPTHEESGYQKKLAYESQIRL